MAIEVNTTAVRKAANTRASGNAATELEVHSGRSGKGAGVRALGSRLTETQITTISEVLTKDLLVQLIGDNPDEEGELWEAIMVYAETGDPSLLTSDQMDNLKKVVAQCQEKVGGKGTSPARRYWPRKVAAVVMAHDATPEVVEAPPEQPQGEGEQTGDGEQGGGDAEQGSEGEQPQEQEGEQPEGDTPSSPDEAQPEDAEEPDDEPGSSPDADEQPAEGEQQS